MNFFICFIAAFLFILFCGGSASLLYYHDFFLSISFFIEYPLNYSVVSYAHRMRTVANAHHIVVLKDGTVAEQGAPDELLARNGEFARMVARQKETGI